MKVGTDGVLLGAWCSRCDSSDTSSSILDIGTGTGLIALMLAQRNPRAVIDAIEVDREACGQATENFAASPWSDRVRAICGCVRDYRPDFQHGLIVSNPPWFSDSLKSPSPSRNTARHDGSLNAVDLLGCVDRLLTADGRFSTILPFASVQKFKETAAQLGLYCVRRCDVCPKADKFPVRSLLEFERMPRADEFISDTLIVETATRHDYTPDFRDLTQDFYLRF